MAELNYWEFRLNLWLSVFSYCDMIIWIPAIQWLISSYFFSFTVKGFTVDRLSPLIVFFLSLESEPLIKFSHSGTYSIHKIPTSKWNTNLIWYFVFISDHREVIAQGAHPGEDTECFPTMPRWCLGSTKFKDCGIPAVSLSSYLSLMIAISLAAVSDSLP